MERDNVVEGASDISPYTVSRSTPPQCSGYRLVVQAWREVRWVLVLKVIRHGSETAMTGVKSTRNSGEEWADDV